MTEVSELRKVIIEERKCREAFSVTEFQALVELGQGQEVLDSLVFFAQPGVFSSQVEKLNATLDDRLEKSSLEAQIRFIRFLSDLSIALSSFLPHWNLFNGDRHKKPLTREQLALVTEASKRLLTQWETKAPIATKDLLTDLKVYATARFGAEAADNPETLAERLVDGSLVDYVENMSTAIAHSNLRRIAEMRNSGETRTELGNDYAAFLQYTMYLGASFVTTNPVLVDIAWVADPERWNPIMDAVVAANRDADADTLARLCTLEVVLVNMMLLRPIFLLTEGKMGSVSLQVNPKEHGNAQAMISDVLSIYNELQAKLDGGVPNVVFKLPGTLAGLEACRAVTSQRIGVNITVNFGMFQQIRFAKAIQEGNAIFSCLTEMNGRLAYPVRDELLSKLDELVEYGIDESQAREAAAWAGVAVVKRLEELLAEKGYSLAKVKPLVASLRIYEEGPGHERLPSAFPDVTEQVGTSIITVFPNVRHAFDILPLIEIDPRQVEQPVPDHVLEILTHSELFKQAYYVGDSRWVADDTRFRPQYELVLEDEMKVLEYPPIYDTLTQFGRGYDQFVERILERKELLDLKD